MKEIKLTQDKVAIVDDEDFEYLYQYKWYAKRFKKNWYAIRKSNINGKQIDIRMHREIMNTPNCMETDHKNINGLDNRKNNLRNCTHQQNQFNRKFNENNKLGIKGVHWHKNSKKFVAQIRINGKKLHLGCFNILGDADSAYRIAEEKHFGEFVRVI